MTDLHEIADMFARLTVPQLPRDGYTTFRGKGLPAPEARLARWAEIAAKRAPKPDKKARAVPVRACHRTFTRVK